MKQNLESGNLSRIKEELERRLIVMRYSKESTNVYKRIFGWVVDFFEGYGETSYSKELGKRFLVEYSLQKNHAPALFKNARTVIRRLDEILEDKMFTPCFHEARLEAPTRFTDSLDKYIASLVELGFSESTIKSHKRYAGQLLVQIPGAVKSLSELTAADLFGVFTRRVYSPHGSLAAAKRFLAYLFESGVTKVNLSVCVPKAPCPQSLPSVYSGEEVDRLLKSIDRTDSLGKRDYAILMLAAHVGLRSSDIVNLSFNDVDYAAKTIKIIQAKTRRPVTLVMNGDVEEAITDYISNGRPKSASDKVFLGSQAPYSPLSAGSGYAVAQKYFSQAGVASMGRKRGPHALRMSYATALVAKGVPYAVVREALGHEDPESAKHYVRVDVKRLKEYALTVPRPIGAFAVLLGDLEGVL